MAPPLDLDDVHPRRFAGRSSLLCVYLELRFVAVRQMRKGHAANEHADDLVIAHPARQPAQKRDELHADRMAPATACWFGT